MSFKPVLFLILLILMMSCGSTKEVANTKTETNTNKAPSIINENSDTETEINIEVVVKETTEKETEVESSLPDVENPNTEEEIEVEDLTTTMNHDSWNELIQKHVSVNGNVNYKGFKSNRVKFYAYIEQLQSNAPNDSWSRNDKLAYWINAYNAFTIDLIIRNYPLQSIKDLKDPWDQRLWKIGSKWYNLNDIEHQILRKMDEPRIHFAIVCASVSCPKLQNTAFTSSKLETQLSQATREFLSDSTKNIISNNRIELSKIFKWFSKDFKLDGSLINFLNQYSEIGISNTAKKSFLDYNWNLNE